MGEKPAAEIKRLRGDLRRKLGNQIGPEIFKAKHLLCSSCSGKGTGLVCSKCLDDAADMEWTLRAERNRLREALEFYACRGIKEGEEAIERFCDDHFGDRARVALQTDDAPTPEPADD